MNELGLMDKLESMDGLGLMDKLESWMDWN